MNKNSIYFSGTKSYSAGNLGTVRAIAFKIAPLATSQALIQLSTTVSISLVSGVVTITGAAGSVYVDGVLNGTFTAKAYKSIAINFNADVTADNVVLFNNFNGYVSNLAFFNAVLSSAMITKLKDL